MKILSNVKSPYLPCMPKKCYVKTVIYIYNIAICWFVHIVKGRRTVIACFDEIDRDTFC